MLVNSRAVHAATSNAIHHLMRVWFEASCSPMQQKLYVMNLFKAASSQSEIMLEA